MSLCVITGAADGIGRSLAHRFGRAGHTILGIDVDAEGAERTRVELESKGISARFLIADLTRSEEVTRILGAMPKEPIDVFVQNAGINCAGRFESSDLSLQRKVIDLNLRTPLLLSAALLSRGSLGRGSSLVFLSSLSHFVGYPGAAVYAASKDGIASYARSLATALRADGIHVMTVFPGPTRTAHARRHSPDNSREQRRMHPDQLADSIHRALRKRKRILVPGIGNRFSATFGHLLPGLSDRAMKHAILNKLPAAPPGGQ